MSSLLEMPDLVMKLVLGKLDYVSVQRLRKTCRTLRNFIDDVKPESNLSAFRILFTPKYLRFFIWFKDLENLQIEYITVDNGCRIVPEGGEYQWFFENSDFLDIAFGDAKILLDFTNSGKIQKFSFDSMCPPETSRNPRPWFLDRLHGYLKFRKNLLKIKCLDFAFLDQQEILDVLPFLEPRTLENLRLEFVGDKIKRQSFRTRKLSKIKILNSPQMENFEFHFRQSDAFDKLTEIFGEISFSDTQYMNGYKRHWFFAYSENSDNLLEITFFENYKYYAFDINKKPKIAETLNSGSQAKTSGHEPLDPRFTTFCAR
ncbi:Protein CBG13427 [Caenorhabditis briggsae]|uniref:Protein CBG13427 n=1 Tax=Caenorhabditis briggsae TaxID=6238 RepID=A8XHS7_CAEBR|nr:Protein CBG13427 [Caenorhabditis briggsae]CAP32193.2 Protein CBG13427 [Caenorhabditis briggsae]